MFWKSSEVLNRLQTPPASSQLTERLPGGHAAKELPGLSAVGAWLHATAWN